MPWSGMKSWVEWGATTGCVLMRAMIRLSGVALNSDLLREGLFWARYGRHRPADRCAAPAGCAALVPEHRAAGGAERAGGQAARRPARGRRRDPRLHRPGRPGPLRLGHARDRRALLRGPHGGSRGARRRRAPPRGRGRLHGRGRGERGRPRPRPRHRAPRGDARAPARPPRHHPDADAGRALDAVRAAVPPPLGSKLPGLAPSGLAHEQRVALRPGGRHRSWSFGTLRLRTVNVKRLPIAREVVMVTVSFVPTGSFFLRYGLIRLTRDAANFFLIVLAFAQPFFCCFLRLVLQVTRIFELASTLLARSRVAFVNLANASQLLLTVEGIGAETKMLTVATLPLPVPSLAT